MSVTMPTYRLKLIIPIIYLFLNVVCQDKTTNVHYNGMCQDFCLD